MKKIIWLLMALLASSSLQAQPWMENVNIEQPNFFEMQSAFEQYWKEHPTEGKKPGYKQFKRWEWYWSTRVNEDGTFPAADALAKAWEHYSATISGDVALDDQPVWEAMGPFNVTSPSDEGIGRVNSIAFHPTDPNTFWVASAGGGIWKTSNYGVTWQPLTDDLPILFMSDIVVDPTDPDILYIATGDAEPGYYPSLGVWKSTDGGSTWSVTGLDYERANFKYIRRLLISPNNPNTLLATTSQGIYQTIDGGESWLQTNTKRFIDAEYHPTNPNIVYATTFSQSGNASFYVSTNGGSSWTLKKAFTDAIRIKIAVTPAAPNRVELLIANKEHNGMKGIWRSNDMGSQFTRTYEGTCTNNLLSWYTSANGCAGQGWYDLSFAIAPNDSNNIWLGGINVWNSTNNGNDWSIKSLWYNNSQGVPVVHADHHFLRFHPLQPDVLFACHDGGVSYKNINSTQWEHISNGLNIGQVYKIGVSQSKDNYVIAGYQDNGTKFLQGNAWDKVLGGDGMECIQDESNPNRYYASIYYGTIYRITNGSYTNIHNNIADTPKGLWVTPYILNPQNNKTILAGYNKIYRSRNRGASWIAISPEYNNKMSIVTMAPTDSNIIYASDGLVIYKTVNGGASWNTLNTFSNYGTITSIFVSPNNSNRIYLTRNESFKGVVYQSDNGGQQWNTISLSLPEVPFSSIVEQKGLDNELYLATDLGVFYKASTSSLWTRYASGMPNVKVTELEISYFNNKIYAGTYGRSVWRADLQHIGSTGIQSNHSSDKVTVYPNPNTGAFYIESDMFGVVTVTAQNLQGKEVLNLEKVNNKKVLIDLSARGRGVYMLKITLKNGQTVARKVTVL